MEEAKDIRYLLKILSRYKWMMLAVIFLSVMLISVYIHFIATPVYKSETEILVNQNVQDNTVIESQDVQANLQLVNTYSSIIESPRILSVVSKSLNHKYTEQELEQMVTVSSASDSQIIKIDANAESQKAACQIANEVAEVFKREIPKIMAVDNVTILSPAIYQSDVPPVSPNQPLLYLLAIGLGLIGSVLLMFIYELLNQTITNTDYIEERLGVTVLASINEISEKDRRKKRRRK